MNVGDVVVDLWADIEGRPFYSVENVNGKMVSLECLKTVRTGERREVVNDEFAMRWLIVSRTGKKKAGP